MAKSHNGRKRQQRPRGFWKDLSTNKEKQELMREERNKRNKECRARRGKVVLTECHWLPRNKKERDRHNGRSRKHPVIRNRRIDMKDNPGPVCLMLSQDHNGNCMVPDKCKLSNETVAAVSKKKLSDCKRKIDECSRMSSEEIRCHVSRLQTENTNGSNKGQKARGFCCSRRATEENKTALIIDHDNVEAIVHETDPVTGDHCFSVVRKTNSKLFREFGELARKFGASWDIRDANANRSLPGGAMTSVGAFNGARRRVCNCSGPTSKELNKESKTSRNHLHRALNLKAKVLAKRCFRRAFVSISRCLKANEMAQPVPEFLGGDKGLTPKMVQSGKGFATGAHLDAKDQSKHSFAIWNTSNSDNCDPGGWCFHMPDVICHHNGEACKGAAVRLKDCTGIEWAGRLLKHGSACTDDDSVDCFGTWFGATMPN